MTTTTEPTTTTTRPATNPHHISTVITSWAIPFVFLGAMWGAGHNPEHADWSAFAVFAIVAIHFVQRIRRFVWNVRNRGA